jgi:DNA-binding CsgD family transcriptional regulator
VPKSGPPAKPSKSRRRGIVLATPRYKIHFADPAARRWLKQFFGGRARTRLLPDKVCRWLAKKGEAKAPKSLAAKRGDARLYLKRQNLYTPHLIGLLLELITKNGKGWPREHNSITPREREVLFWLARGKSNAEIGLILGISAATVGKHLEHIYPKLGVENRTAAASFAANIDPERALKRSPPPERPVGSS